MKWAPICRVKEKGGLGVRSLSLMNKSLLCKWCWHYASEGDWLWKKVIKGKYREEGGWRSCEVRDPFKVGLWKTISKEWDLFSSNVCYAIRDGKIVKFWKDKWCSQEHLKELFPILDALFEAKEAQVANLWEQREKGGVWNFHFAKNFNNWELDSMGRFLQ